MPKMDWDIDENYTLTAVTGYVDLDHWELNPITATVLASLSLHNNCESFSQEIRIASQFDGSFNFQGGIFWQEIEQEFDAYQYAVNIDAPNDYR